MIPSWPAEVASFNALIWSLGAQLTGLHWENQHHGRPPEQVWIFDNWIYPTLQVQKLCNVCDMLAAFPRSWVTYLKMDHYSVTLILFQAVHLNQNPLCVSNWFLNDFSMACQDVKLHCTYDYSGRRILFLPWWVFKGDSASCMLEIIRVILMWYCCHHNWMYKTACPTIVWYVPQILPIHERYACKICTNQLMSFQHDHCKSHYFISLSIHVIHPWTASISSLSLRMLWGVPFMPLSMVCRNIPHRRFGPHPHYI